MEQVQRNTYYDTIKYFLFILVVLIHNPLPGIIGNYLTAVARCAVPMFFCISGYFYKGYQQAKKKVHKVTKYMGIFCGMNLFWFILNYIITKTSFAELAKWAKLELSIKNIVTCLLFGEAYGNQYLWYLHAIAMVYLAVIFIEFLRVEEVFCKISPFWVLGFWVLAEGLVIVYGRGIPGYLYRNWFVEGLGFFFLGTFVRKMTIKLSNVLCGVLIVLGICFTIIECRILGRLEFYLGSFFIVLGAMFLGENVRIECNYFAQIGQKHSLHLYLWHPLVAYVLVLLQIVVFGRVEQFSIATTGMVIVLTTIIVSGNYRKCLGK